MSGAPRAGAAVREVKNPARRVDHSDMTGQRRDPRGVNMKTPRPRVPRSRTALAVLIAVLGSPKKW